MLVIILNAYSLKKYIIYCLLDHDRLSWHLELHRNFFCYHYINLLAIFYGSDNEQILEYKSFYDKCCCYLKRCFCNCAYYIDLYHHY